MYTHLHISHTSWKDLRMDFVLCLSKIVRKYDFIFVVVDRLFFRWFTSYLVLKVLILHIWLNYFLRRLLGYVAFQPWWCLRDSLLVTFEKLFRSFWDNIEVFFFAFHPQTNSQTEIVNRSLGDLFRCLVGENLEIRTLFCVTLCSWNTYLSILISQWYSFNFPQYFFYFMIIYITALYQIQIFRLRVNPSLNRDPISV